VLHKKALEMIFALIFLKLVGENFGAPSNSPMTGKNTW